MSLFKIFLARIPNTIIINRLNKIEDRYTFVFKVYEYNLFDVGYPPWKVTSEWILDNKP